MLRPSLLLALIPLFLGAGFAPEASAQSVGFSIGKRSQHGSIELHVSNGFGAGYSRSCPTPRFSPTSRRYDGNGYRRTYPVHRVWVPSNCHREWVPARYETRYDPCGRAYQVLVSPGGYVTRCHHGYWR